VKPGLDSTNTAIAAAETRLARLDAQAEAMHAVLVRLLQDVVLAERRLEDGQAAELVVEANQQLVAAALDNQAKAEVALEALKQAEQSGVLDALTQLPNRRMLVDRFAQAMANARRGGDTRFALLFVDLDNFKQLNDLYGHAFGDEVLKLVAARLVSAVREVDTVSRHGGDEFVVLLAALHQPGDAQAVAEKLIAAIGAPADLAGHVVRITASVGIALYPDDGEDVETLIARADAAMYRSKRQGRRRHRLLRSGVRRHAGASGAARFAGLCRPPWRRGRAGRHTCRRRRPHSSPAARGQREAGAGRAQRAGIAGGGRAGAATAERVRGRGGGRVAQSGGTHPHRQRDAGPRPQPGPAAAAAGAEHRRTADDADVAPGRQPRRRLRRRRRRLDARSPLGRHGRGHRPRRRVAPAADGTTPAALRDAPPPRRAGRAG
jgi:diguanylate cyclase (GGDEF)-like protein